MASNNPLSQQMNDKAARLLLGKALQVVLSDAWGRESHNQAVKNGRQNDVAEAKGVKANERSKR